MDYREVFEIVDLAEIELACKGFDGFFFAHSEETQLEYRFCLSRNVLGKLYADCRANLGRGYELEVFFF